MQNKRHLDLSTINFKSVFRKNILFLTSWSDDCRHLGKLYLYLSFVIFYIFHYKTLAARKHIYINLSLKLSLTFVFLWVKRLNVKEHERLSNFILLHILKVKKQLLHCSLLSDHDVVNIIFFIESQSKLLNNHISY